MWVGVGWAKRGPVLFFPRYVFFGLAWPRTQSFFVYQVLPKSCADGSFKKKKKKRKNVCICIMARTSLSDSISTASVQGLIFV